MFSPGKLVSALLGASLTAALVAAPYCITLSSGSLKVVLLPQTAAAQDSGEGSDSGGGDTSGSGEGSDSSGGDTSGSGEGSDSAQEDTSDSSGDSEEEGSTGQDNSGSENADTEAEPPATADEQEDDLDRSGDEPDPLTGDDVAIGDADVEVVHPNGMREEIRKGRYEMIDAQGRIIVSRSATEADLARLLAMFN